MIAHFTSRVPLDVWRRHRCARCATEYGYYDDAVAEGGGLLPFLAERAARREAARAARDGSRVAPCPACGHVQPEMAAWRALAGYRRVRTWGTLAYAIVVGFALAHGGSPWAGPAAAAAVTAFAWALRRAARPPRPDPGVAAEVIRAGTRPPTPDAVVAATPPRSAAAAALLALCFATASAADVYFRLAATPFHPEFFPPVAGPRDTVEYVFRTPVVCDELGWHGAPRVVLRNADELGVNGAREADGLVLPSWSRTTALDGEITFRDSRRGKPREVSLEFAVPHDVAPGSTLRLGLALEVSRPMRGGASYDYAIETESVTAEESFVVGAPDAGALFRFLRVRGLLVTIVGAWLAATLAMRAARAAIRRRASEFSHEAAGRPA